MELKGIVSTLVATLALTSCGGGGDGSNASSYAPPVSGEDASNAPAQDASNTTAEETEVQRAGAATSAAAIIL